ncbi:2-dehydro-3-deoxygalactonokinase [Gilvimarinus chinensis]|uniref:2-dehydro-3-deoxygalactonokinase n=1 Tax=Gilvimarinus chinensis TaxID=396005 RepID=UPI00036E3328|nr:2-dehydro-3-deoxygalactonokinase [Gilvimarinus chinensis]
MTRIFVDWGSTNCRAFLLDDRGALVDQRRSDKGALAVTQGDFESELKQLLRPWQAYWSDSDIWLAGMVGSRRGWYEVPYAKAPATASDLRNKAFKVNIDWARSVQIIPGVSCGNQTDRFDVMRGEEVQLIGLSQLTQSKNLYAMLPGTHNKHAHICDGAIGSFSTHPTGELFSVLSRHMLIGFGLDDMEGKGSIQAFFRGVDEGVKSAQLGKSLFTAWTNRLGGNLQDEDGLEYISGVLIGNELRDFEAQYCAIVSDQTIGERYRNACTHLGIKSDLYSGAECYLAGMKVISQ